MTGGRLTLIAALTLFPSAAMSAVTDSTAENPCQESERWTYSSAIPPDWKDRFHVPVIKNEGSIVPLILDANARRNSSASPEVQFLSEYAIWRAFYARKAMLTARQGFDRLLARLGSGPYAGIRLAALECINQIHRTHPTIVSKTPPTAFKDRSPLIWESIVSSLQFQIPRDTKGSLTSDYLKLVEKSGPYSSYLRVLIAARDGNDSEIARAAHAYFRSVRNDPFLRSRDEMVTLILGRAYYGLGHYEAAARKFASIPNTSNLFANALSDLSWAHLMKGEMSEAVAKAQNLTIGQLGRTFNPEANLVMSIAMNETCHFPEAIKSIKHFRTTYGKAYWWLQKWKNQRNTAPSNMYQLVASYIKSKKGVPDKVATEWIRSPLFLANQEELNVIYDERAFSKLLLKELERYVKGKVAAKWKNSASQLSSVISSTVSGFSVREKALVSEINRDLSARTEAMIVKLAEVAENLQFVEAEAYDSLGEKMIVDNALAMAGRENEKSKEPGKKRNAGPTWEWGAAPSANDESAEVWEDELGFLQTEITDDCT